MIVFKGIFRGYKRRIRKFNSISEINPCRDPLYIPPACSHVLFYVIGEVFLYYSSNNRNFFMHWFLLLFSNYAPARGATRTKALPFQYIWFQSTHPRGVRQQISIYSSRNNHDFFWYLHKKYNFLSAGKALPDVKSRCRQYLNQKYQYSYCVLSLATCNLMPFCRQSTAQIGTKKHLCFFLYET